MNYLLGLAWNWDPPYLSFLNSQNYRCEPPETRAHSVAKVGFIFLSVLGLELRAYTLSNSTSLFL
jgi:hypothetical protein